MWIKQHIGKLHLSSERLSYLYYRLEFLAGDRALGLVMSE